MAGIKYLGVQRNQRPPFTGSAELWPLQQEQWPVFLSEAPLAAEFLKDNRQTDQAVQRKTNIIKRKQVFLHKHKSVLSLSLWTDVSPHITGCVSANMETFRCRWNTGPFQSGQLRLFYINKKSGASAGLLWMWLLLWKQWWRVSFTQFSLKPGLVFRHPLNPLSDWSECPHYSTHRPNECFFSENHTTIWTSYTIQLRSRDESITYDQKVLDVANIGELPVVGDETERRPAACLLYGGFMWVT